MLPTIDMPNRIVPDPAWLKRAAVLLGARGLAQGREHDPKTGALDVRGALRYAGGLGPLAWVGTVDEPRLAALLANGDPIQPAPGPGLLLNRWNDAPDRTTYHAVRRLLELAAMFTRADELLESSTVDELVTTR